MNVRAWSILKFWITGLSLLGCGDKQVLCRGHSYPQCGGHECHMSGTGSLMGADGTVPAPGHYRPRSRVDHMDMHEVIRQRRSELGMSQANLATKVGVDRRQIRRYETGETQPTLSVAKTIARALGITIDELVGDETHRIDLTGDCVGVLAVLEGQRRGPQPPRGPPDPARRQRRDRRRHLGHAAGRWRRLHVARRDASLGQRDPDGLVHHLRGCRAAQGDAFTSRSTSTASTRPANGWASAMMARSSQGGARWPALRRRSSRLWTSWAPTRRRGHDDEPNRRWRP